MQTRRAYPSLLFQFCKASHRNIFEIRSAKTRSTVRCEFADCSIRTKISLSNILPSCPKVLPSFVIPQNDKESTLSRRENSTISNWKQKVLHHLQLGTKFAEPCCKASPGYLTSLTLGGHLNPATVPVITLFTVLDSGIVRS